MRVIEQLVSYLNQRGLLTTEQLDYLRREGYMRRAPEPSQEEQLDAGFDLFGSEERAEAAPEDRAFAIQEALERARPPTKTGRTRRRRASLRRARAQECRTLRERLGRQIGNWEWELEGLLRVGRRLAGPVSSEQALLAIRNAPPATLAGSLAAALEAREPPLDRLWLGLSLDTFRAPLDEAGLSSPIARAYGVLIERAEQAVPASLAWMLREGEIRWVQSAIRAQRALLACLGRFDDGPGDPLSRWLRRDYHPGAYWAFVIVHSARRADQARRPGVAAGAGAGPATPEETAAPVPVAHAPRRRPLEGRDWMRAWAHALAIEPNRVTPFLTACCDGRPEDEDLRGPAELGLTCPEEWDR